MCKYGLSLKERPFDKEAKGIAAGKVHAEIYNSFGDFLRTEEKRGNDREHGND